MCNCKTELEQKLTERFAQAKPQASAHRVELMGYGIGIAGNTMVVMGRMEAQCSADFPTKTGVSKYRVIRQSMVFSFCPFCGERAAAFEVLAEPATA